MTDGTKQYFDKCNTNPEETHDYLILTYIPTNPIPMGSEIKKGQILLIKS